MDSTLFTPTSATGTLQNISNRNFDIEVYILSGAVCALASSELPTKRVGESLWRQRTQALRVHLEGINTDLQPGEYNFRQEQYTSAYGHACMSYTFHRFRCRGIIADNAVQTRHDHGSAGDNTAVCPEHAGIECLADPYDDQALRGSLGRTVESEKRRCQSLGRALNRASSSIESIQ